MRQKPYLLAIGCNLVFVVTEIIFAAIGHSTALLADAFHNLTDVLALVIAWLAVLAFRRRATARQTYGWHNASILASLVNVVILVGGTLVILYDGARHLWQPEPVRPVGTLMIVLPIIGIVVNVATALLFKQSHTHGGHGHHHQHSHHEGTDLNAKTAYLHLLSDAAVAAGVAVAGVLVQLTGWAVIDPLVSLAIGAIILYSSWGTMTSALNLSVNGVPDQVNDAEVRAYFDADPRIVSWHDLHIWPLSTTESALTVHVIVATATGDTFLTRCDRDLRQKYQIDHVTVQVETQDKHKCNQI